MCLNTDPGVKLSEKLQDAFCPFQRAGAGATCVRPEGGEGVLLVQHPAGCV